MGRSRHVTGRGCDQGASRSFGFRPLASYCALWRCPLDGPLGPRSAREPSAVVLVSGPPARRQYALP